MSIPVVQVRDLAKSYLLHHKSTNSSRTLREELMDKLRGLGRAGGRSTGSKNTDEVFWALRDLSFDVEPGERIAIIGRNGAGKSTLLKLLSRITRPTAGEIRIRGRLSSLLEVGTGFHSELSGRENIFLNGAILGMTGAEVRRKFDDIVQFAEVERFLDTPVKRYSSGMYVRLAFAVSAFLEPDITILDEVLSVGDAAFQRKCQAKMLDMARDGRTVIFVSHSMSAVKAMCTTGLVLDGGRSDMGKVPVDQAIARYLSNSRSSEIVFPVTTDEVAIENVALRQHGGSADNFDSHEPIELEIAFSVSKQLTDFRLGFYVKTVLGDTLLRSLAADWNPETAEVSPGRYVLRASIPANYLAAGNFVFELHCSRFGIRDYFADTISFPFSIRAAVDYNRLYPAEEAFGYLYLNPQWRLHSTA